MERERMARHLSTLILVVLALTLAPVSTAKSRAKPRKSDGNYTLKVGGYLVGQGTAEVKAGSGVKLKLDIASDRGGKPERVEISMPLSGTRFLGDAKVLGKPAHFQGRIDIPDDDKERALRGVRLVCRIRTTDDREDKFAYVVGFVPELAAARDRIDHGDDEDKDDK